MIRLFRLVTGEDLQQILQDDFQGIKTIVCFDVNAR